MENKLTSEVETVPATNQSDVGDDATPLMFDLRGYMAQETHDKAMSDARRDYEVNANALQARINELTQINTALQVQISSLNQQICDLSKKSDPA